MKLRWFAVLACVLLVFSMSMAIDDLGGSSKRRPIKDDGSSTGKDDSVSCTTVYYYVCAASQNCVSNTGAGACCGDCRQSNGTHAPCQTCVAN
jgi:hypothetical protein